MSCEDHPVCGSSVASRLFIDAAFPSSRGRGMRTAFPAGAEPSLDNSRRLMCERHIAGDRKFDFSSSGGAAVDVKAASNSLGSFAHARQPPVTVAAGPQALRVNTVPVVPHPDSKLFVRILELDFDILCGRVPDSIDECLPANAIDLVTKHRV